MSQITSGSQIIVAFPGPQGASGGTISAGTGIQITGSNPQVIAVDSTVVVDSDLSAFTGSTSITTLGTIGTGVWQGTTIALNKGGTGATDASGARSNLGLGTAAVVNTGTTNGTVPLLGASGTLPPARIGVGSLTTANFLRGDGQFTNQIIFPGDGSGFTITGTFNASQDQTPFLVTGDSNPLLRTFYDHNDSKWYVDVGAGNPNTAKFRIWGQVGVHWPTSNVEIKPPVSGGSYSLMLPNAGPASNGQALVSDTNGTLSFGGPFAASTGYAKGSILAATAAGVLAAFAGTATSADNYLIQTDSGQTQGLRYVPMNDQAVRRNYPIDESTGYLVEPSAPDGGNGKNATPFNKLSDVAALGAATLSNKTIYLGRIGEFDQLHTRNFSLTTGSPTNIKIQACPGVGMVRVTGGVVVKDTSGWTNLGTNLWRRNIGTGLSFQGATFRYYTTLKPQAPCKGMPMGHIPEVASSGAVATVAAAGVADAVYYDSATGNLDVALFGTGTTVPEAGSFCYNLNSSWNAIGLSNATNCTVDIADIWISQVNYRETNGGDGYGILFNGGCSGCKIIDSKGTGRITSFGDHAAGFLAQGTGQINSNNWIDGIVSGSTGVRNPDSHLVHFTSADQSVLGARQDNCISYVSGCYTRTGAQLPPRPSWGTYQGGLLAHWAHTGGGAGQVSDLKGKGNYVEIEYNHFLQDATVGYPTRGSDFGANGCAARSGDEMLVASRPVQWTNCRTKYGMGATYSATTIMSFDRCVLLDDAPISNQDFDWNRTGAGAGVRTHGNAATGIDILFSGCQGQNKCRGAGATLPGSSAGHAYFRMGYNSTSQSAFFKFLNSTFVDRANETTAESNDGWNPAFFALPWSATAVTPNIRAINSVFARTNSGSTGRFIVSTADPTLAAVQSMLTFTNVAIGFFSDSQLAGLGGSTSGITSQAFWTANIDSGALFFSSSPWLDLEASNEPKPGSSLFTTTGSNSYPYVAGYNSVPGRSYGAYQLPYYISSIALSLPNIFTVSGSPLTANGTLTATLATQTANRVFAGPTTGSAAAPTFRASVSADLPAGAGNFKWDESAGKLYIGGVSDQGSYSLQTSSLAVTGNALVSGYVWPTQLRLGNNFVLQSSNEITDTDSSGTTCVRHRALAYAVYDTASGTQYAEYGRGVRFNRTATASNYTVLTTDYLIGVTSTASARTITLPTAVGVAGRTYVVKDESGGAGTNNITLATTSSQTIDGAASKAINTNYGSITVYSDGANWFTC